MAAQIRPRPVEVAALLDPSRPCYIAGHSLGSAVATIWALRLALLRPELSEQIRLYSFAGPRVGDPTFVKTFGALVPNAYRVVNLADSIPLVPASTMGKTFAHVGQQVSFVGAVGELLLNHVVDLYQLALERGVETTENLPRSGPEREVGVDGMKAAGLVAARMKSGRERGDAAIRPSTSGTIRCGLHPSRAGSIIVMVGSGPSHLRLGPARACPFRDEAGDTDRWRPGWGFRKPRGHPSGLRR